MKITQVTIGAGQTFSIPGEYGNIKPHVSLTAALEAGDDPDVVIEELRVQARQIVEDEIDAMLVDMGESPHFYNGPRYQAIVDEGLRVIALISERVGVYPDSFHRLPRCQSIKAMQQPHDVLYPALEVEAANNGYMLYDWSCVNTEDLPALVDGLRKQMCAVRKVTIAIRKSEHNSCRLYTAVVPYALLDEAVEEIAGVEVRVGLPVCDLGMAAFGVDEYEFCADMESLVAFIAKAQAEFTAEVHNAEAEEPAF